VPGAVIQPKHGGQADVAAEAPPMQPFRPDHLPTRGRRRPVPVVDAVGEAEDCTRPQALLSGPAEETERAVDGSAIDGRGPDTTDEQAARHPAAPGGPGEPGLRQRSPSAVPSHFSERPAVRSDGRQAASSTGCGGNGARAAGDDRSDDAPAKARTRPGQGTAEGAARLDDDFHPPEEQPIVPENASTPSGLPVRVPQANLAPPLRTAAEEEDERQDEEPDEPGRSPEEVLRIMGSYQKGTRRGRDEAARMMGTRAAEGEDDH